MDERQKQVNAMLQAYSSKIAEVYEKDIWAANGADLWFKTIAFLLALENAKISTLESITAVKPKTKKKIGRIINTYVKAKKAAIRANRKRITKMAHSTKIKSEERNSMYR